MAINNWWGSDSGERYWMEIRSTGDGLGEYLLSPKRDASGRESWSYALTSFVQPGDRVFHWYKTSTGEPAIVGWSEAEGPLETIDWAWQARGTSGRARGEATRGEAWRMPLRRFTSLEPPITREMINGRRREILAVLEAVAGRAAGAPYAPFQNYGGTELRAQQGYLTKFPAALVDLLFARTQVGEPETGPVATPRPARGQGYMSSAAKRSALEEHSVQLAIEYYRARGAVDIEVRGKPYDLRLFQDGIERHIEVKGSVGVGIEGVQLTQGEVDHANTFAATDLFVVDEIVLAVDPDDETKVSADGGRIRVWSDWNPDDRSLRPTHLRYRLPI